MGDPVMKWPRVECRHCGGTGRMQLPEHLLDILVMLRKRGASTAAGLHRKLLARGTNVGHTAVNNRLEALRREGLATRVRVGKEWFYTASEAPREDDHGHE